MIAPTRITTGAELNDEATMEAKLAEGEMDGPALTLNDGPGDTETDAGEIDGAADGDATADALRLTEAEGEGKKLGDTD